jgi:hypothetical protein
MTIIPNDRTEEEVKVTWISLKETYHNRLKTREMQRRLLQDPEYRAAIEYVKVRLGRHTGSYAIVDLDDDEPNESSIGYETAVITKLTQLDARGLENAGLYASRPTAIHVRSVQEALRKGKPDNYIAELCRQRSGPALAWAQTSTFLFFIYFLKNVQFQSYSHLLHVGRSYPNQWGKPTPKRLKMTYSALDLNFKKNLV